MKILIAFVFAAFTTITSFAQQKLVPAALRVDLLQNADAVYDQGRRTSLSLEQAASSGSKFQFSCVNSRLPIFSWVLANGYQSSYQIKVASRKDLLVKDSADMWNSGLMKSGNSIGVLYNGALLQPSAIYYWKVRIWDASGKAGGYSAIQSFYMGEHLEDFGLPSFTLVKTSQLPLQASRLYNNSKLYDFGNDGFGQLKVYASANNSNDTLVVHLGEALTPNGHVNNNPPGSVRYKMISIPLSQGHHAYRSTILPDKRNTGQNAILMPAYIGEVLPFRYAEIVDAEGRYAVDSVSRDLVTSVFNDDASIFTSSDTILNKIWDLCKYTIKATSFSGYYVDGDRERIPYEADALINQLSHYSSDAEFSMAKRTLDYLIYHPTWPTEWSLQNILIAWNDYLHSGDLRLIRKLYPELKSKLLSGLAREDGLISTRTGKQTPGFLNSINYKPFNSSSQLKDIVDWPLPGGIGGKQSGVMGETDGFVFTDYNAVVNAWYYAALQAMANLSAALGEKQDASHYKSEAVKVGNSFRRTFLDAQTNHILDGEGTLHSSLHANFFALAFGLVPEKNIASVVRFIHSREMACSVYGAQFLLDALYRVNDDLYAKKLMTSTGKRSWFNMLREGASMTMEAWGQEYKPNQDWNHAWGTAPANIIVKYLAGIQPLTPGYGEVQIKPQPGDVEHVALKYRTIRGDITLDLINKKDSFKMQLHLPGNITGRVYLPFNRKTAIVKMDGRLVKPDFIDGYFQIRNVRPGKHDFEVYL